MGGKAHNTLAAERRKARHYGMQALYQWHMAGAALTDIEAEFRADYDFAHVTPNAVAEHFCALGAGERAQQQLAEHLAVDAQAHPAPPEAAQAAVSLPGRDPFARVRQLVRHL